MGKVQRHPIACLRKTIVKISFAASFTSPRSALMQIDDGGACIHIQHLASELPCAHVQSALKSKALEPDAPHIPSSGWMRFLSRIQSWCRLESCPLTSRLFRIECALIVLVSDLVLVFQQPVDRRFVAHRFVNRLSHRAPMNIKQRFVIEVFVLGPLRDSAKPSR